MARPKKEPEIQEAQEEIQDKPAKAAKTVKMRRDDGLEADVHPEMVQEYALGGYKEV